MTYAGGNITVKVEAAFGADPDVPAGWSWTDISADLLTPGGGLGAAVTIQKGRMNQSGRATPTDVQFALKNFNGQYTPGLASGSHYPYIRRNLPIRISLVGVGASDPYERVTAFVYSFEPAWDDSLRVSIVNVRAAGRFRRLQQGNKVIDSSMFSNVLHNVPAPYSYWPMEDGAGATQAASALGQAPAYVRGLTFASNATASGSKPLPVLGDTGLIIATVPAYTATGFMAAGLAVRIPTAPASTTDLFRIYTSGTAAVWTARIDPASPDTLTIKAYDSTGTTLATDTVNLDETIAYSLWAFVSMTLTQSGADINYEIGIQFANGTGVGKSGTLAANTVGIASTLRVPVLGTLGLSGAAVGHLCFWNDPTLVSLFSSSSVGDFIDTTTGVSPATRFTNLRDAAGLSAVASVDVAATETSILMGPTAVGSVMDGWREVEDVDGGIIHDGDTNGDIDFLTRAAHYNAAVVMTVPMSTKSLQNPFAPTYDDQLIVTDCTVSVRDGSSATYSVDIGEGTYTNPVTLNLFDDTHAYEIAGWIVGRGTLAGMRYPKVTINLRHTGQGTLPDQWLACRIGSRIQVTVTMAQHPPDTIDLELIGYTERFSSRWWDAELVCTPFAPYVVGVLDSATLGHLSSTTMVISEATWDGVSASFSAAAVTEAPSTAAGDYPLDLNIAGQRTTVSACASLTTDPFTRTTSSGWGTTPQGQAWTVLLGTAADHSTTGTRAQHSHGAVNTDHATGITVASADLEQLCTFIPGVVATGSDIRMRIISRYASGNNFYAVRVTFNLAGAVSLDMTKRVAGSTTVLDTIPMTWTYTAASLVLVRFRTQGSSLSAKAWLSTATEPDWWQVTATDTDLTAAGRAGVHTTLNTGNTNASPVLLQADNYEVVNPRTFTVSVASVNGVSKSHPVGDTVALWQPMRLAL